MVAGDALSGNATAVAASRYLLSCEALSSTKAQEMALFGRGEVGDDRVYRYRVRCEKGLLDVKLGLASNGKVAELDFSPVEDWNAPIQQ